jgi:hypothetical protein
MSERIKMFWRWAIKRESGMSFRNWLAWVMRPEIDHIAMAERIAELQAAYDHTVEDNTDLVRQLDWIKENHSQIYLMAAQQEVDDG